MARKSNKRSVPGVLWRMFRHRARTLSDTVTSLLPPPPKLCRCDGRCCLGCTLDAKSFLLRPDDPSDYHRLLTQCFVVVSENAPSLPFFVPPSGLSQDQVVKRTIEQMLHRREPAVSNVLCSGYDRIKCSSRTVELLSSASWSLLLSRVGDNFMIYLLRNTSIFLPAPLGNHHQVGGPPISRLCFDMLKGSPRFGYQTSCEQKRKRTDADDLPVEKRKCHISGIINGPLGFSSNLGMTDKSSMQLIRHHRSRNYDVSVSEVPKLIRTETVIRKSESEGNQGSNCITPRLGKRSRPFSWQRRRCKMLKQLTLEENSLNIQPNTSSLSYHAELQMSLQCACCLILQSLPAVPKRTNIQRQSIFYSLEPSRSVLPKKNILYSLKPNLACSEHLIGNIFGFSDVNASAQPMSCLHNNDSGLINSECLYHSLVKCFKQVIRRTQCCQHTKLLNKHCVFPLLNKNTIRRSSSGVKDNTSRKNLHEKCVDTLEAISSLSDGFKSYCSKSQVVSFVWAVSRTLLPSELLGTPPAWRILRKNISKFIHLRRFETFRLKLCMHRLKISWFPFLSNKYFFHEEFKNRNDAMHVVKRKLLEKWIFWYFSCLVVPLLQANFYVTESGKGRHDIYYYAKPVWEKLISNTIVCFKEQRYSCLDDAVVHNILRNRKFGFSKLRLQPKEDGVRMVANLKCSSTMPLSKSTIGVQNWRTKGKLNHQKIMYKRYLSVNSVLHDAHSILKGILFGKTDNLGSSVFDYDDVYRKLCPFLVGQKKKTGTMPILFIITSDVVQAFDSIDQNQLLNIVENVLIKDEYFLKQYHQVMCTKKSLWVQKQFMMSDETSNNGHIRFTPFKSFQSRHCVFVNQGGVLSSLLCSVYYGHLEKRQADSFFSRLQRGFRGYNCYMNEKKFGANFDVEQISGSSLNRVYVGEDGASSFLRWSGLLINCSTMEIQADYTKYLANHLSSTLTVRWQGKPGINLKEKLCLFLRPKCHPIFFDSNINSAAVVRLNVFQVFLLCAMKFHCYIRDLSFICKFHKRYCSNIIEGSLRYMHLLIKKRMHSMTLNSDVQPILVLEKEEVEWLGLHAYIQVLKRKESRHKDLLAILRSRLLSHRMSGRVSPELKYAIDTKNSSLLWEIKY
ncbi:telomerase reverse transcriptase isoform X5 [Vigna radiata var. radiata]|uniref:Telomerase reverse transcriptase n=1 Tax=Vigna radiata var. radiata TaxID=3916 RepID=A0A3Q0F3D5_VIGRR|nr:telomerase reverse transcriptase isoform X5 [Vigna radiata var. radiata]